MELPLWRVQRALPTNIEEHFKTTEPIPGHPLYRGRNPPPGFMLHPKSNAFVPACQQCLLKEDKTPNRKVSCNCQEALVRPYVMPTTMLANLYPLTYQVTADRATHHNTYEPLLGDEAYINMQCELAFKHFNLGTPQERLTLDDTKTMIKNALRDRPFKGEYIGPAASVQLSVIRSMIINGMQFLKGSKPPEALETPFSISYAVIDVADTLSLHLARDAPPEPPVLLRFVKQLLKHAKSLELRLNQVSMATTVMYSAIPTPWKEHRLISGKVWFSQTTSEDTNQWRRTNIKEACKILATAIAAGPTMDHYKKAEPHLLHAIWTAVRILATAIRTWFEYEAATNANTYWNSKAGQCFKDPIQDIQAGSDTRRDDLPRAGLYPHLPPQDNQRHPGPSAPAPSPVDATTHDQPKRHCPQNQWQQPLTSNTSKLLAMMTLTLMLASPVTAAPFSRTTSLTPGSYAEDMEIEGMFAYNDFIYVHKGTRLVNPNIKQAYRQVETQQLTQVPLLMQTLVGAMDRICGIAKSKLGTGNFITFFRSTKFLMPEAEIECAKHQGTIGIANNYHTVQRMQYYLQNTAPHEARAPVATWGPNFTMHYPDGQLLDLSLFGGLKDEHGLRWKSDLHHKKHYIFSYKLHDSRTILIARECTPKDATCGVPMSVKFTCSSQNKSPSTYTACNTGISMMIEHTKEMSQVVHSLFPKLPPEGKITPATHQILQAAKNFTNPKQRSTSSLTEEFAKQPLADMIDYHLTIPHLTMPPPSNNTIQERARRAIGILLVGILGALTVAQVATTATQIQGAGHSANLANSINLLNQATRAHDRRLQQVEEDTRALAHFITDIYNQQVLDHEQSWFEKTALEIELRFSDLVQSAHAAINRLGVIQLAKGQQQVLPSMLSTKELRMIAKDAMEKHGLHLTTDLEEVKFDLIANGTDLFTVYQIPIVDEDRRLSLFEITPVPSFTESGFRIVPGNAVPRAGFQRGARGWVPMTDSEFQKCIHEKHSCRVATPIRPETAGACGISNYFESEEDSCTYVTTSIKQDFFHTSGNFTCFSVKKRTMLHMKCRDIKSNNHGIPINRGSMTISQAGCFTFNDQCNIRAEDGQTILPSSIAAEPLRLNPASLVTTGGGPRVTLITSQITQRHPLAVVSEVKRIFTRAPTSSPINLMDIKNTRSFTWSSILIIVLIAAISIMICKLRRASATQERVLESRWKDMQQQQKLMRDRMRRAGALFTPSMQSLASNVSKIVPKSRQAAHEDTQSLRGEMRTIPKQSTALVPVTRSMQSLASARTIYQ